MTKTSKPQKHPDGVSLALKLWTPSKGLVEVYNPATAKMAPPAGILNIFKAGLNLVSRLPKYVKPFRSVALPATHMLSNIMYGKDFNGKDFKPGDYLGNAWRLALGFTPGQDFPIPVRHFKNHKELFDFYDDWTEHYYRARERGDLGDDPFTITLGDDIAATPSYANSTNALELQFTPTGPSSKLPAISVARCKGTIFTTEDQSVSNNYNLGLTIMGVTNV